ncbi:DUF362 domain-containing protein [Limisalsivibrio acetivorans]|uniref:DUF362 domain-containing protein n=1 Tax=Limisalsivibrio acetivorans TaxID=1304888 RepID=UPI0003B624D3|nr:DUF362 domain-containing protein [Limisalsivibrio acetivorans]
MSKVYVEKFDNWHDTVERLLDKTDVVKQLQNRRILLKPNLVEPRKPPITTPAELVGEVIDYLRRTVENCEIIIAEGTGSASNETADVFRELGYEEMAKLKGVHLMDLNHEECITLEKPECTRWPEMTLPKILFDSFIFNIPVLKAHTLADVTLSMKNMMGAAPPSHYQKGGHWKKAEFHKGMHEAVFDLNQYRQADFTLLDATVGMQEAHLYGPECDPPKNRLAASFDPVSIDAWGADLLGFGWKTVEHIKLANGVLGEAEYTEY